MQTLQGSDTKIPRGEEWKDFYVGSETWDAEKESAILQKSTENIEKLRKSQVEIQLFSEETGKPVPLCEVEIVQKSHSFLFGDQMWELDRFHRFGQWDDDKAFYYRERFKEVFNAANALCYWTEAPRNDGPKIEDIQGRNVTEHFAACVDWAISQGLTVKGHPLFWSIPKCVPSWLMRYDYQTRMKFAEVRVRNLVSRFKAQISIWDTVNEALWEPVFKNLDNRFWPHIEKTEDIADMIAEVLTWCNSENPDAIFLINDYGLEEDPISGPPLAKDGKPVSAAFQRQRYIEILKELSKRGTAPDAVGLQSHPGKGWVSLSRQYAVFDEIAQAGLPLHVTEFWAHTDHLDGKLPPELIAEKQAEYVKNILTISFGHPAVEAFFFWGFIDDAILWKSYSAHSLRPLFTVVRDLIHKEWNSSAKAVSDSNGIITFKGFHGKYSLRAKKGLFSKGKTFSIEPTQKVSRKIIISL